MVMCQFATLNHQWDLDPVARPGTLRSSVHFCSARWMCSPINTASEPERARWRRRFNGSFLSSTDWFKGKFTGNPIFNEKSMVSCRLQPIQWSVELVKPILSNTGVWHYNNMMWWFWLSRLYQPSIFLTKFWVLTPIVWYIRGWGVSGRQTIELFANIHTTVKSSSVEKAKERTIKLVSVQRYKVCEFYVAEFWPLDVDRHKWKVLKHHKCLVVSTLLQNNMSVCVYECRYVFLSPILLSLYIYVCVCQWFVGKHHLQNWLNMKITYPVLSQLKSPGGFQGDVGPWHDSSFHL